MDVVDFEGPVTLTDAGSEALEAPPLARGTAVSRYIVADLIGWGGMGVVYKAFDPELNRPVALKLLSTQDAADPSSPLLATRQARLLREAQALAQLSHPNVVTIYDVGLHGGTIFMAMEYVEGRTLKELLEGKANTRKELLEVLKAAGQGLAAAHRVGIIHRDFKPQNVILGSDGRVRVIDFGLARGTSEEKEPAVPHPPLGIDLPESTSSSGDLLISQLTQAGAIVGTPQYMAPEQHLGHQVDHRSDQFSFCVALFEVLYGARPFGGKSLKDLVNRITQGKLERPAGVQVPAWLDRITQKGLRVDPLARYGSMAELLAELENDPAIAQARLRAKRFKWAMLMLVVLLAGLAGYGLWYGLTQGARLCRGGEEKLAGVWDEAIKGKIKVAFGKTGRSYAQDTYERVAKVLDGYTQHWVTARREACEATHLRGEQSEKLLDLRMQCLERRLGEVAALTSLFTRASTAGMIDRVVSAALGLTDQNGCADAGALTAAFPPPDPSNRARVEGLQTRLAEAQALERAGQIKAGLEIVAVVEQETRAIDYPPVRAQALFQLGSLQSRSGDSRASEGSLKQAAQAAARARDSALLSRIWAVLLHVVGYEQARGAEALSFAHFIEVTLLLAGDDPGLRAEFENALGSTLLMAGQLEQARTSYQEALAIRERTFGPESLQVTSSLNNLGLVLSREGKFDEAVPYLRRALAITEKVLGPENPDVGFSLTSLGEILRRQGDLPEAIRALGRSLRLWEASLGPKHPFVAYALVGLGGSLIDSGRLTEGQGHLERALALREEIEAAPGEVAEARFELAKALGMLGQDPARALNLARQAWEYYRKAGESMAQATREIEAWLKQRGGR